MMDAPAIPHDRSVRYLAERWISTQQALVAAGNMTPEQADNRRICLEHFTSWCGPISIDQIDAQRIEEFFSWCFKKLEARRNDPNHKNGWSPEYAKKVFATARSFIGYLCESDLIATPKNLQSKRHKFGTVATAIKTWTVEEAQHVISEAPGKLKLALMLMLNTGMTQVDVSDLLDTEVNWTEGTITRKRSKTRDQKDVPVVCYKLWPFTFQLLQQYRSGQERVLLTESSKPYVRAELIDGKLVKSDNIRSNFAHLQKRLKFKKSLKLLRKTAATMLESHPVYGRYTSHFLGHSPRSIKDKHYAAPSQELFDEAIAWLGQQFGFLPGTPTPSTNSKPPDA
jgi:integrase